MSTVVTPSGVTLPLQNAVRLCGNGWAPCGYCKGARAHLAATHNNDNDDDGGGGGGGGLSNSSSRTNFHCTNSCKSYSVLASHLSPAVYEQLINYGWRRSGVALYVPSNFESCCPALTIRLAVDHYQPTKTQTKVAKRMHNLLHPKPQKAGVTSPKASCTSEQRTPRSGSAEDWDGILSRSGCIAELREWTQAALTTIVAGGERSLAIPPVQYKLLGPQRRKCEPTAAQDVKVLRISVFTTVCAAVAGLSKGVFDRGCLAEQVKAALQLRMATSGKERVPAGDVVDDDNDIVIASVECHAKSGHVIAHLNVRKRSNGEMAAENGDARMNDEAVAKDSVHRISQSVSPVEPNENDIKHDRLRAWWLATKPTGRPPSPPYNLVVTTLSAHESALDPRVHRLYWVYQHVVHQDPDPFQESPIDDNNNGTAGVHDASSGGGGNWGHDHSPAGWREKVVDMLSHEYRLLPADTQKRLVKAYASFYEFLVENPFDNESRMDSSSTNNGKVPMGTYHQHYTLSNDFLIAVGVVDVLPTGVSSVYLFYDPSFAHELVPLGKYAILREIEWTKNARLPYYYLGYYIMSCRKMNYKGDYHPSELLCPTTKKWVDAEVAKTIIQEKSPEHHCCTLFSTPKQDAFDTSPGTIHDDGRLLQNVGQIPLEVGVGTLVTLGMLHPQGQLLVRPLLQEFIDQAGPETALQCTVNFR